MRISALARSLRAASSLGRTGRRQLPRARFTRNTITMIANKTRTTLNQTGMFAILDRNQEPPFILWGGGS